MDVQQKKSTWGDLDSYYSTTSLCNFLGADCYHNNPVSSTLPRPEKPASRENCKKITDSITPNAVIRMFHDIALAQHSKRENAEGEPTRWKQLNEKAPQLFDPQIINASQVGVPH